MKKTIFLLLIISLSFPLKVNSVVVINEVQYDALQSGREYWFEWVELYNTDGTPAPLNGWIILDNTDTDTLVTTDSIVDYVVIAADSDSFMVNFPEFSGTIIVISDGRIGYGLTNSADMLLLKNSADSVVDWMNWETPDSNWTNYFPELWDPGIPGVSAGHSLGRSPNGSDTDTTTDFADFDTPTPGELNTPTGNQPPSITDITRYPIEFKCYPNPVSATPTIYLSIPEKLHLKVRVYDSAGRVVKYLADRVFKTGKHTLTWNGQNDREISSGVYFVRMESEKFDRTLKVLLVK